MLDAYESESEEYFDKLSEGLPEFQTTDDEILLLKQSLLKSAFALICGQYMHRVMSYYEFEDIPMLFDEMGYSKQQEACYYLMGKEGVEWDMEEPALSWYTPFAGMLEELLYKYRNWWMKEVIIPSDFIDGIFGDDVETGIDAWSNSESFFNDY